MPPRGASVLLWDRLHSPARKRTCHSGARIASGSPSILPILPWAFASTLSQPCLLLLIPVLLASSCISYAWLSSGYYRSVHASHPAWAKQKQIKSVWISLDQRRQRRLHWLITFHPPCHACLVYMYIESYIEHMLACARIFTLTCTCICTCWPSRCLDNTPTNRHVNLLLLNSVSSMHCVS